MATGTATATKPTKGKYMVLSNLHHSDADTPKAGKLFRRGETVLLSDEHAAPLLKSKVVLPVK
jgi:hypothetical protein